MTCQGSVPEAIIAFLESDGVEDAIRNAISLGGDADGVFFVVEPVGRESVILTVSRETFARQPRLL